MLKLVVIWLYSSRLINDFGVFLLTSQSADQQGDIKPWLREMMIWCNWMCNKYTPCLVWLLILYFKVVAKPWMITGVFVVISFQWEKGSDSGEMPLETMNSSAFRPMSLAWSYESPWFSVLGLCYVLFLWILIFDVRVVSFVGRDYLSFFGAVLILCCISSIQVVL